MAFRNQPLPPIKNPKREISSGIIVFRRTLEGPRFLILYHGHNQWTFPRGKIEGEERSFAAALRETREETGFTRNDLYFIDYFKAYENWTFIKHNQKVYKTVIFYLAETTKKHVRLEVDFEGYGWFTYREALKILLGSKNDENRKVLRQAYEFLHGNRKEMEHDPSVREDRRERPAGAQSTDNPKDYTFIQKTAL
jgi:8-oxo-dGTP pyrophosphatase MutT (NUDIX family)